MTRFNEQKETCSCRVCRSDMAYVIPCDYRDVIEFEIIGDPPSGEYEISNNQTED